MRRARFHELLSSSNVCWLLHVRVVLFRARQQDLAGLAGSYVLLDSDRDASCAAPFLDEGTVATETDVTIEILLCFFAMLSAVTHYSSSGADAMSCAVHGIAGPSTSVWRSLPSSPIRAIQCLLGAPSIWTGPCARLDLWLGISEASLQGDALLCTTSLPTLFGEL